MRTSASTRQKVSGKVGAHSSSSKPVPIPLGRNTRTSLKAARPLSPLVFQQPKELLVEEEDSTLADCTRPPTPSNVDEEEPVLVHPPTHPEQEEPVV